MSGDYSTARLPTDETLGRTCAKKMRSPRREVEAQQFVTLAVTLRRRRYGMLWLRIIKSYIRVVETLFLCNDSPVAGTRSRPMRAPPDTRSLTESSRTSRGNIRRRWRALARGAW